MTRSILKLLGPVLVLVGGVVLLAWGDQPSGWALVAGTGLFALLGTMGRRCLGILLMLTCTVLANGGLRPVQAPVLVGSVMGFVGASVMLLTATWWTPRRSRFETGSMPVPAEAAPLDVWKAMDAGLDPTEVDDHPRESR
ncbi:Trp biosynthesis-associated membrane protein [Aestuariimicrobium sp. p3-SID1156]|uniref:Trp biosynthesis-associated membrane protein n=1 Tax=Aestuariimicrobium sp. p3-SID1156 TaxID=2916038 RepID=UPI00223ADAED|nr:Trp biosynthesis-associated membrane protein [Aestuariimicrobium sp. p3-SID1156]MCT1459484.1 Trp biosynthesis-associated membrane protein [Aestuariimicrobium sp. p3-SID1156]